MSDRPDPKAKDEVAPPVLDINRVYENDKQQVLEAPANPAAVGDAAQRDVLTPQEKAAVDTEASRFFANAGDAYASSVEKTARFDRGPASPEGKELWADCSAQLKEHYSGCSVQDGSPRDAGLLKMLKSLNA